ncbi:MAG TPA: F0F1 ATP synthase subunit A [Candidatus Acidoferrales bacterium]|nr:F0F1 ATP synthase subunit A [Candidatus Acidoferrales bacterium]
MEHDGIITELLNRTFGHAVAGLLAAMGITVDPEHALPDYFVTALVIVLASMAFVLWLKPRLSAERPGGAQQLCEFLLTNPVKFGIRDLLDDNVGHAGREFLAMTGTVGIFVLLCNLASVIPLFNSPTGHPSVPLACAVVTFVYFNAMGVRHHGVVDYLKLFSGTNPFLAVLLFPVEIISTCARVLSLTVRLWANMFSSELLYGIFLGMLLLPTRFLMGKNVVLGAISGIFPATLPVAFVGLHIFVAVIQAFVFTILPSVYLGMAVAEEH